MPPRLPYQARLIADMDTPYRDILYTNTVPSDNECTRIRELVGAPMDEITSLDQDIAVLKVTLERLSRQRERLTEFVEAHLALVSQTRRLPEDILREIFAASLPRERYSLMSRTRDSPLVFTYVCSEWRRVAFSMPRLWTKFHIVPERYNVWTSPKLTSEGVKFWLNRSGSLPLSISVAWSDHGDGLRSNAEEGRRVLQTLAECSLRWEHVRFALPSPAHFALLAAISPTNVPLLETVVLDAGEPTHDPAALDFLGFTNGPRVNGISLKSPFAEADLSTLVPSGPQIQFLSTLGTRIQFSTHSVLTLLARCPQLETCALEVFPIFIDSHPRVSLTKMRRLCVVVQSTWPFGSDITGLWENIDLPSLQCLEYSSAKSDSYLAALTLLGAPQRLTRLNLSLPVEIALLDQCLSLLPNLENLLLHQKRWSLMGNGTIACPVFRTLTPSTCSVFALCPRLQSLTCLGIDAGSDQELLAFVEARRALPSPLPQLHIAFPRAQEVADIDVLVATAGMSALLRYPTGANLEFMTKPRGSFVDSRSADRFRDGKQAGRNADWGPISTGWAAEYEEWGVAPQWAGDIDDIS
ncbi:hypothetical protein C8R46DRAFT_1344496 [Mycena filopes]|nr:hypothetical protein C8R46DRAFT_1344496 [Mycena filopes]